MNRKIYLTFIILILLFSNIICVFKGIFNIYDLNKQIFSLKSKMNTIDLEEKKRKLENEVNKYETLKYEYDEILEKNPNIAIINNREYKIDDLWEIIGTYATEKNVKINIELEKDSDKIENEYGIYNLKITANGKYENISGFISYIENDENFIFKISNLEIEDNKNNIVATFEINRIKIKEEFMIYEQ